MNDDGFAYMNPEQQQIRANFYHDNNIGWVARPKNNSDCGYVRRGKFKKASNVNFALNVANKAEDELLRMLSPSLEKSNLIDPVEEETFYQLALSHILETDSRVKAGGNIRVGEHTLLVDSDTRVVRVPLPLDFVPCTDNATRGLPPPRRRRNVSQPGSCHRSAFNWGYASIRGLF